MGSTSDTPNGDRANDTTHGIKPATHLGGPGSLISSRSGYNHVRLPRLGSMWGASIPTVAGHGGPASVVQHAFEQEVEHKDPHILTGMAAHLNSSRCGPA
ncbi:unnamed protein product [Aspergillus oryzae]|nr:unnamed protein product [Aspergillus oryzae]